MNTVSKLFDHLILAMFAVPLLAAIGLVLYSVYAVAMQDNLNAVTSIAIGCVCLALSIVVAKNFRPGGQNH